jgi:hypothetical protein
MSITEVISAARALSQDERRKLAQTLLEDLANEEAEQMFRGRRDFHIYNPEFGRNAVAQLAQLLEKDAKSR